MSQHAHIYRWDRQGRKGQLCLVLVHGTMNTCLIKFEDGHTMVTSRNALKLANSDLPVERAKACGVVMGMKPKLMQSAVKKPI